MNNVVLEREDHVRLTNLLVTLEHWTDILDVEDGVDVAYLDFRKAFDLVSHRHLLYKMSKCGITGKVLKWVESFLYQRKQRVVIRGTASESFEVTSGVPQGSILGRILFLIFINYLPLEVISPVSLFADDSKIFTRIVSEKNRKLVGGTYGNDVLQRDLESIREWANKWKMEFNVSKCKIMHLGRSNPQSSYSMGGEPLTVTSEEKDLGVLIDDSLEFGKHIKEIVNKANRMLGLIKIGFDCMNREIFMNLYPALVRPLLEYCVQVWSPYKRKYINLIEGVQRRATKLVPELRNLPYEERLRKLGLTTLEDRRVRGDMIETYKLLTGKEDVNPDIFFKISVERGDQELVRGLKIYKKRWNGNRRRYFYSQRVGDWWNKLRKVEIRADTITKFKRFYDRGGPVRLRVPIRRR